MLTDEQRQRVERHWAAFSEALRAAVDADPELEARYPNSREGFWVDYGDGNDGYRVSSYLRNLDRPTRPVSATVQVSYVTDYTPEATGTVLYEQVPPDSVDDLDHQVSLALDAIRAHHAAREPRRAT